jgi:uncharacterized tellurite resistance protein B-like protein
MFQTLKAFIAEVTGPVAPEREFLDDDYRLATAALLVHAASADGLIAPSERVRLCAIIETQFGLDAAATSRLIALAEQSDKEAVDFFHFTNVLKRALDDRARHRIIEMMWDIVFADGVVTEFEENVVWRVAELLGVSTRDRVLLRQKAAGATQPGKAGLGPWGAVNSKE